MVGGQPVKLVSLGWYGNNVGDNVEAIKRAVQLFRDNAAEVVAVVYQFNFNDLVPVSRDDLKNWEEDRGFLDWLRRYSWFAQLRHELFNYSSFLRVLSVKSASLMRDDTSPCSSLGAAAMTEYSFAFAAEGMGEQATRSWQRFEDNVQEIAETLPGTPFAILIVPLSTMVHPQLEEHHLALPPRMDCATIDPIVRLQTISNDLGIRLCNPTDYMVSMFNKYQSEGNTTPLYHESDENHPNLLGSLFIGEYCYTELFEKQNILNALHNRVVNYLKDGWPIAIAGGLYSKID